uniref:Uncharacterized protein n=1 Tax=Tanacetum cinerariifolium TaxID=118510 RepID=A0A6L2P8Z1_TANCI|nr:hypothetical protein [Tanacetum cinerariifolium]
MVLEMPFKSILASNIFIFIAKSFQFEHSTFQRLGADHTKEELSPKEEPRGVEDPGEELRRSHSLFFLIKYPFHDILLLVVTDILYHDIEVDVIISALLLHQLPNTIDATTWEFETRPQNGCGKEVTGTVSKSRSSQPGLGYCTKEESAVIVRQNRLEQERLRKQTKEQAKAFACQTSAFKKFLDFYNRQHPGSSSQYTIPRIYTPHVFPRISYTPPDLGGYRSTFDPRSSCQIIRGDLDVDGDGTGDLDGNADLDGDFDDDFDYTGDE